MNIRILMWRFRGGQVWESSIIKKYFEQWGAKVTITSTDKVKPSGKVDIQIHSSEAFRNWMPLARFNIAIPNQEQNVVQWTEKNINDRTMVLQTQVMREMTKIWAKTHHAEQLYKKLGCDATYLGFISQDLYDPTIEREESFALFAADNSFCKDLETTVAVWKEHKDLPPLFIHCYNNMHAPTPKMLAGVHNIILSDGRKDATEMKHLFNRFRYHLCPSRCEGWGHYIVEAMGVKAIVVATDAPPMNEHITKDRGIPFKFLMRVPCALDYRYHLDPRLLYKGVLKALRASEEKKKQMQETARSYFDSLQPQFERHLRLCFQEIKERLK